MRIIVAFILAPILPALTLAWSAHAGGEFDPGEFNPASAFVIFCGLVYVLQATFGAAIYWLLTRYGRHRGWVYVLVGFCCVALPFFLLCLYRWSEHGYGLGAVAYVSCQIGLFGAFTGLIFWLLARPDKIGERVAG